MPYIVKNKKGEITGVINHPAPNLDTEYVAKDDARIQAYKEARKTAKEQRKSFRNKINNEIKKIAIQALKATGDLPQDYPEPTSIAES